MSQENDENGNSQSAKVLKLGFNISVTGDPDADFEIVLDDKANVNAPSIHCESQSSDLSKLQNVPKPKVEWKTEASPEVDSVKMSKNEISAKNNQTSMSRESSSDNPESSSSKELSLINDIKSTMQHFERFSDHIREVPRFKIGPVASSTPFPDKKYSKSELNLIHPERRYGRFSHTFYDFNTRREYMRGKPFPSDLFLRPLPGADLYRRGMFRYDNDPLMMYGSIDSLTKSSSKYTSSDNKTNFGDEKYGLGETIPEVSSGILKKSEHDSGEKSTSSAESVKDIKIYQNGGILIMQNFKENLDVEEKRDISDLSAKLIANCKRLKEEIDSDCTHLSKPTILHSSGESQSSGKMVQFDLLESDYQKNKLDAVNSSLTAKLDFPLKPETLDFSERDSILENQTCQDFLSMSTQDDSIVSNAPGMSPGASGKKLEWDSGADVGYLNLDLSKENLSTIEKIVLRGLSSDGLEKNVVYEKKSQEPYYSNSKVILERKPSEIIIEEIVEVKNAWETEKKGRDVTPEVGQGETPIKSSSGGGQENEGKESKKKHGRALKGVAESKSSEPNSFKEFLHHVYRHNSREKAVDSTVDFVDANPVFAGETSTIPVDNLKGSEPSTHSKSSKTVSKGKRAKKKSERQKSRVPCAISREKLADSQSSKVDIPPCSMKIPKKLHKKQEARPESSDAKDGRKEKEIDVNRSSETKEEVTAEEKEPVESVPERNNEPDRKKPIKKPESATSTKTVLSNPQAKDSKKSDKSEKNLLIDEMIQTNEYKVESVGVQAFSSQKSSVCNTSSSRRTESDPRKPAKNTSEIHVSSKNIQVFGTNSSLPKELGHPKETNLRDVHNTKGTQFFGEPISSLPNYHSHQIIKPEGSSRRIFQVLKTKKSLESERMTAVEENKRNIMANDSVQKVIEEKKKSNEVVNIPEDKENLLAVGAVEGNGGMRKEEVMSVEQTKKKRGENDVPRVKESKKSKKEILNTLTPSDGVSCKSLTSEHLKQHGDSIDRNLIKEIYFQSQLVEIGKREMISKSTSMDILFEPIKYSTPAEKVTVGCQYSLRSKEGTEEGSEEPSECLEDKEDKTCQEQGGSYHSSSGSNQVKEEENYTSKGGLQGCGTGDSFASSTQTANSWVPGMQDSSQNNGNAVGRARSFEYLPGHIYESSGNLREKLPSENEENVITGSSSDLEGSETTNERRRKETNDGEKSSEGRKTLVLENSNDVSWDSCQLKSLDENLTRLNIVVTRLREKDDQIRKITRSVLVNLWRHNGSGDGVQFLDTDTPETKIHDRIDKRANQGKKKKSREKESSPRENVSGGKVQSEPRKIEKRDNDVSIGCQTEPKSAEHTLEKYQNERKELESRLAADKESQIKWIEKEIYHLNVLRGILEKQTSLNSRRKQSPNGVVMSDESRNEVKIPTKEVHPEDYQRPVTPAYGCTISVLENSDMNKNEVPSDEKNTTGRSEGGIEDGTTLNNTKYGMAVSLNGNLRKVMLLPVGVQVSLTNADFNQNRLKEELSEPVNNKAHTHRSRPTSRCQGFGKEHTRPFQQSDVMTQYPSAKKSDRCHPSTSVQADLPSPADCGFCHQKTCVCLSLSPSENSEALTDRYSKGERTLSDRPTGFSKRLEESGVNQSERKTMSNTTGTSTLNVESLPESNQRFHGKTNERSVDSTTVTSRGKGTTCQCENCPRRNASSISKPLSTHKQSQSTSGLNHKKCMNEPSSGSCRCSKMQVMKSSACHVIKIVGPSCCSSEDGTCHCKNRNVKKTENQSCQTENVVIENKELVTNSEIVKPNKEPGIIYPAEGKLAVERRHSVDEKYLYSPKVSYDRRQSQQGKIGVIEKNATQKQCSEDDAFTGIETPALPGTCDCSKNKKKQKKDDHPRHYFLKIEEREMDDSNESSERRRSLEVITVTVPVKKAGKAKIYKNDFIQTSNIQRTQTNSWTNQGRKGCTCCKECIDQKSNANPVQDSCQESRKVPAEKPDSYRKIMKNHKNAAESEFGENVGVCGDEFGFNERYNASSSSQEDCNRPDYVQSGPYRERQRMRENVVADCYSRDSPSDYDSHIDYRPQSSGYFVKESHKGKKSAMVERYVAEEPFEEETVSRGSKSRKQFPDQIPYDSDYYNYDKREFKTKSEILREEQKKKKNHQPSLQEYLESNRPDFCSSAESRRRIISERARERVKNHGNRIECLMNLMHQCQTKSEGTKRNEGTKRIFTTPQMREQTMKRYRQLPEVTEKVADQKKKEEYKTNKLMADIFAKKLQLEALKGHINLSNSVSVLSTI